MVFKIEELLQTRRVIGGKEKESEKGVTDEEV
jgi:hypothetical protein